MKRSPVRSSNLKAVGYDPKSKTLEIEFQGGSVHQYSNVSPAQHSALVKAPSVGSHFHQHFRNLKSKPL